MMLLKIIFAFFAIMLPIMAQNSHMFRRENEEIHHHKSKAFSQNQPLVSAVNDDYRMPTALSPISYFIRLLPFVNGDLSVRGYEEIIFEVVESTSNITLQMVDLTYYEDTFILQSNDDDLIDISFIEHTYDSALDFYIGSLAEPLEVGRQYKLSLSFEGLLTSQGILGFYESTYVNENGDTTSLATTQMQPNFARSAFPCFDEPSFKATFQIEMGRENSMTAISNMPLLSSRDINGLPGWTYDLFDVSPIMSSYLNAFVVSDFVSISATSDTGIEYKVWTHASQIYQAEYGLDAGHRMSTFFEDHFQIPYPLPKQDMIAIPDYFFGAMENWGLITYRESGLLVDPVLTSLSAKRGIAQLIGHEVAHMWTGNLVTCEWWSDAWLNEGFAAYYQYYGTNAVEPGFDIFKYYVIGELQYVFVQDSLESSLQIRREVPGPSNILSLFSAITYSKGSALVRMMEYFLTAETFTNGLTNYLNGNAYSNALQENLFDYLNDQAQLDGTLDPSMTVHEIMETWTLQPGYPLITVQINGDGTAVLSQERYLQTPNPDAIKYTYWVPITFTSSINYDFDATVPVFWMSPNSDEIIYEGLPVGATWHIFNIQQSGYYRVNYDDASWSAIATQLVADNSIIDIRNRAQLLDDSFTLAQSGRIPFDIPFSIASYLSNEDHYVPWTAALRSMNYIEKMFSRTVEYTRLREFLRGLLNPPYDIVGSEDIPSEADNSVFLRAEITPWVCDLLYQPCMDSATKQYLEWMGSPDDYSIISPNLKSSVYCTAVSEGNTTHWEFALDRYQSTESSDEVGYLLFAMACSQDKPTLISYLDMAFNGNGMIEESNAFSVFANVASTDMGRDVAWDYLVNNHIALGAFYESFDTVQSMAAEVAKEFNTQKDLEEMQAFKIKLEEVSFGSTAIIDGAIQTVEDNIAWMNSYYNSIASWLTENGFGV